ncbi:phenylalanyl-tRNA synthetase alpha chain [Culex quinquefasciatus]|uniref:Phenylalanyl-tRNA synthetase alpha chain n=1 Tax=Culex quinquefasciatus TaxID=7176 RepID=B0XF58_CULQU|nr:phenylalanyl-tRNA synthetase alpha chain [Culex quinquefasciatus]|eukprot:XP_001868280.1 phenylalanyl-tRNA synthetase alpha chain [Culex quinquefasciatus]
MKSSPNAKVGFSKAMSNGWIQIDSSGGAPFASLVLILLAKLEALLANAGTVASRRLDGKEYDIHVAAREASSCCSVGSAANPLRQTGLGVAGFPDRNITNL